MTERDQRQLGTILWNIAGCLSALDALIAAQAEKLDALGTHKRGLMQQRFPAPMEGDVS